MNREGIQNAIDAIEALSPAQEIAVGLYFEAVKLSELGHGELCQALVGIIDLLLDPASSATA